MKVLIVAESLRAGGAQRQTVELMKGLVSRGIECVLVTTETLVHFDSVASLGIRHIILKRNWQFDIRPVLALYRICKLEKPDVIHTWNGMCTLFCVPAKVILRIPLISGHLRDAPPTIQRFSKLWIIKKLTFPISDAIVSNSEAGLLAYGAPPHKSFCIRNGFDFGRVAKYEAFELENKKNEGILTVGMVATFLDRKDYDSFVNAAIRVCSYRNDVKFISIGDGPNRERIMKKVPPELIHRIQFLGNQKNVESLISLFDIGLLLSAPIHGEGIANSIIEYMAMEKPVIASINGGNNELVENGVTGYLIRDNDENELVEKINYLLNSEERRVTMGQAGRRAVENQFGIEKMLEKFIALYSSFKC